MKSPNFTTNPGSYNVEKPFPETVTISPPKGLMAKGYVLVMAKIIVTF